MTDENQEKDINPSQNDEIGDTEDVVKLKEERDNYLDGWRRAKADLANYKKEEFVRLEEVIKFSSEDIIKDVIEVLDSFELALETMKDDEKAQKGIYLIKNKLENILKKRGLNKIEVEIGQKFDPEIHEAVMIENDDKKEDDTIAEELETGYTLYTKVLRATKVKVYKRVSSPGD